MSSLRVCMLSLMLVQAFLVEAGLRGGTPQKPVSEETVYQTITEELKSTFKGGKAEHISGLEGALRTMYTALPLEEDGAISHAVVRYALHRFFVQKHGWFIRGLEPSSETYGSSETESEDGLAGWVPSFLQNFLEEQLGQGIGLRELALLAATLEDLIHKEVVERMDMTFTALEYPEGTVLDHDRLKEALEVYMMIYHMGGDFTVVGKEDVLYAHKVFTDKIPDWGDLQDWMHGVQLELFPKSDDQALNFDSAERVVEEAGKRYADYNDLECSKLRAELLDIESAKAGRIRLNEFYKRGLQSEYKFDEKQEYLRTLGVLDESNVSDPYVIVPNYVAARPNCLIVSTIYVVCCRNECEDFLLALESKFQSPAAKPDQILEQIASMSSKTIPAPRELSDSLVQRLNQIAQANHGVVPLHGRLFSQWMHHAFPRECPYPQQAGTTNPQTPGEWMQATGQEDARNTVEEIEAQVDGDETCVMGAEAREKQHLKENELTWDDAEELLRPVVQVSKSGVKASPVAEAEAAPTTRLALPRRLALLSALPSLLTKLATLIALAFCLALMAWKVFATGKEVEPMNPITFVQYLLGTYRSSKVDLLPHAQQSSLCA